MDPWLSLHRSHQRKERKKKNALAEKKILPCHTWFSPAVSNIPDIRTKPTQGLVHPGFKWAGAMKAQTEKEIANPGEGDFGVRTMGST